MYQCNKCGKKVRGDGFYCRPCKQEEIKKMKQRTKANDKRISEILNEFEDYLKSGKRTY